MSLKNHPILLVILILGITALILGGAMALIRGSFGSSASLTFSEKIGVIPILGTIKDSSQILSQLIKFKKDNRIKAIILRIDSPGGGVGPSQEVFREVRKTIKHKKVIISMGSVAASGGYYIAAAGNKIVANPGTITGSIGVIMEFLQFQELSKKIGVSIEVLKSGEFKDVGSPHREMSEREKVMIKELILDIQSQFVKAVALGRNLPEEKVVEIADGRIISGAKAKELGLVDQLGNFQDAVELTKQMVGIEGDVDLVYPRRDEFKPWDLLFESAVRVFYRTIKDRMSHNIEYRWDSLSY